VAVVVEERGEWYLGRNGLLGESGWSWRWMGCRRQQRLRIWMGEGEGGVGRWTGLPLVRHLLCFFARNEGDVERY